MTEKQNVLEGSTATGKTTEELNKSIRTGMIPGKNIAKDQTAKTLMEKYGISFTSATVEETSASAS